MVPRVLLAISLLMIAVACQKEEISPVTQDAYVAVEENASNMQDEDNISSDVYEKSTLNILGATNANQIPAQMFAVNPIYKTSYYHYKQPDNVSCSWTTYVNCINCIVSANNTFCYPTPISIVRYRCQNYYPGVQTNGASHILALEWHVGKYDNSYVYYNRKSTEDRWLATKLMLNHINTYRTPFIVRSSMNGVGHYRLIFSIDWKQSESLSMVYYTDCYPTQSNGSSFQSNVRSMRLVDMLNSMKVGATYYNMLFMWPK